VAALTEADLAAVESRLPPGPSDARTLLAEVRRLRAQVGRTREEVLCPETLREEEARRGG
jgi:hypothetical protein